MPDNLASSPTASDSPSPKSVKGLKASTIAGIVVGSLAGLMVNLSIFFILWRRKQNAQKRLQTIPDPFMEQSVGSDSERNSGHHSSPAFGRKRPGQLISLALQNPLPPSKRTRMDISPAVPSTNPMVISDTARLRDDLVNLRREMEEMRTQRVYETAPPEYS